jgi:Leucine-rich repeat (LRR) protein
MGCGLRKRRRAPKALGTSQIMLKAGNTSESFQNKLQAFATGESTELDFSGQQLKQVPAEVLKLGKLETLQLSNNAINTSSASFKANISASRLIDLKRLDLEGNRMKDVPEGVLQLPKLETLCLSNNVIKLIPRGIVKLSSVLVELELNKNFLQTLPEEIGSLKNLRSLHVAHNVLRELPEAIGTLPLLTTLWLEHNRLATLPDTFALPALEDLNLHDNRFPEVPKCVLQHATLQWLSVGKNKLKELNPLLFEMPSLRVLHLQNNKIAALPSLHPKVRDVSKLESLWLSGNRVIDIDTSKMEALKILVSLPNLTDVRTRRNKTNQRPQRSNSIDETFMPRHPQQREQSEVTRQLATHSRTVNRRVSFDSARGGTITVPGADARLPEPTSTGPSPETMDEVSQMAPSLEASDETIPACAIL